MVPRTEIVAVPTSITFDELVEVVRKEGRSRIPVYQDSLDDIVGVVHVKDIVRASTRSRAESFDVRLIAREVLTAPETLSIDELLALMKAHRTHIAIVIDEFGGTAGLTTLEDLLEVIVGEVQDEFERPINDFEALPNGLIRVNGLMLIDDFNRRLDVQIDDPDFDSIGGFVFGRIGHKPEIGDEVRAAGLKMRVDVLDGLRIARLTIERDLPAESTVTNGHAGQTTH
jgi:CBS domain containing-hemolysin-like protein